MRNQVNNLNSANKSNTTQRKQSETLLLEVSNDLTVQVTTDQKHEFLMTTSEVAIGYGCTLSAIFKAKDRNTNDLIEGKHFMQGMDNLSTPSEQDTNNLFNSEETESNTQPNQIYWTKRGIVRLGFMLKSSRAVLFRNWAEDLIIAEPKEPKEAINKLLNLNDNEKKLLSAVKQNLYKGDITEIAKNLQLSRSYVSKVISGQVRSYNVMEAFVERAKHNFDINRKGYSKEFVQTSLELFNL